MFDVRAYSWKWILIGVMAAAPVGAEVIFEEDFDDQPDWHSGLMENSTGAGPEALPDRTQFSNKHRIPDGWYAVRQDPTWAPSVGHPDRHEAIEILESNADKARSGKMSFVSWRDSFNPGWNRWNSESILMKFFPEGYDQIYVSFYIKFSPEWTPDGASKIFRVYSWSGESNPFQFFGDGEGGPLFDWKYSYTDYGVRNALTFRGGPHGENYSFSSSDIEGAPRSLSGAGDLNLNYTGDTAGMALDGGYPKIRDLVNGGYISDNLGQTVEHEQVFGDGSAWTKMAFFVKMNSAVGVADGEVKQWINDELVFRNDRVRWVSDNSDNKMVKWNAVAIGGNDFFRSYPNSARHEEWYAIDDIVIATEIPQGLMTGFPAPNPPTEIRVD